MEAGAPSPRATRSRLPERRTQSFYRELFRWRVPGDAAPGYGLVDTGAGHGISGVLGASQEGLGWANVYAKVDDVEARLARARGSEASACTDPSTSVAR